MEQWIERKWEEENRKRERENTKKEKITMDRMEKLEKRIKELSKEIKKIREMIIGVSVENEQGEEIEVDMVIDENGSKEME